MIPSITKPVRQTFRSLASSYSGLRAPIRRVWNIYEEFLFVYSIWRNHYRYSNELAALTPTRLYDVPTGAIRYHSKGGFHSMTDAGSVSSGEWDMVRDTLIEEKTRYKSFQKRFIDDVAWNETELYQKKSQKIRNDQQTKFATIEALDRKCDELDYLFKNINDKGYKSQVEIAKSNSNFGTIVGDGGEGLFSRSNTLVRHEVAVDIARDGTILLNEGRHRTCIAKLLNVEEIPVRIVVRHREWQNLRNHICEYLQDQHSNPKEVILNDVKKEFPDIRNIQLGIDHPDLQPLFEDYRD